MANVGVALAECFLSGQTSDQCLMHELHVIDSLTSAVDVVYISDYCWKVICNSNDRTAANFWKAYKQAVSAGYTDDGFVRLMKKELGQLKCELVIVVIPAACSSYFAAISPPIGADSGNLRCWCRSAVPLPARLIRSAEQEAMRFVVAGPSWNFIDERYLIATPPLRNGTVERAAPPFDQALYEKAKLDWGDPPDIFRYVVNAECLVGYEIIRRMLV